MFPSYPPKQDPDYPCETHLEELIREYNNIINLEAEHERKTQEIGSLRIRINNALTYPERSGMIRLSVPEVFSESDVKYHVKDILNPEFTFPFSLKKGYWRLDRNIVEKQNNFESGVTPIKIKKTLFTSYVYNGRTEELNELYNRMKGVYIAEDTDYGNFKKIFSGVQIDNTLTPIRWHDNNASELLYFIKCLCKSGIINNSKSMNYRVLKACFVTNDSRVFNAHFKELKTGLDKGGLSTAKIKAIDKFVTAFL
ncbi:MAG: hypothetical protein ACLQQ4_11705 [Bacteroidia bacterium]